MAVTKFLNPQNDIAFKRIFGTEKNSDILVQFLNDMLEFRGEPPIVEVTFLKTIQDPEIAAFKTCIVDVMCVDLEGNQYIVEMQVTNPGEFLDRVQYYAANAYTRQLKPGEKYKKAKPVALIAITNFSLFPEEPSHVFKTNHATLNLESHKNQLKGMVYTFLELSKFNKDISELETMIDKWAYFFKHAAEVDAESLEKITANTPAIKRAYDEIFSFNWTEEQLRLYEEMAKYEATYYDSLDFREAKGKADGKAEEKLGIARKMLAIGDPISKICELTGLLENEVLALRDK